MSDDIIICVEAGWAPPIYMQANCKEISHSSFFLIAVNSKEIKCCYIAIITGKIPAHFR